MALVNQLKKIDWTLNLIVLLLILVGLLTIYSISQSKNIELFKRQLFYVIFGFILMILVSSIDYRTFRDVSFLLLGLYFLSIFLLVLVLLIGKEIRGVNAWIKIKNLGFQPVELVKLSVILVLAKYFSLRHTEISRPRHLFISGAYISLPVFLLLLQPELGYVLILVLIWLIIVGVAGIKFKHLLIIGLICLLLLSLGWFFWLKEYQKERIISFLNPYSDPLGRGYHIIQSIIAVGSGKLFGRGLGKGPQSHLNFLPEQHTDFIFATFAEEWGFIGIIFILSLFGIFFYRLCKISLSATNNFARLFVLGFATMILLEAIINIAMNLGLLPIIGIPLPFISYGGSSMIINFIGLGIIQSIIKNK